MTSVKWPRSVRRRQVPPKCPPSLWDQLDALLQQQYKRCWNFAGLGGQQKYIPEVHVQYTLDGSLIGQPVLLNPPSDPNLRALAESAMRAVRRCDPLRIPSQYQLYYDQWKRPDRSLRSGGNVVKFFSSPCFVRPRAAQSPKPSSECPPHFWRPRSCLAAWGSRRRPMPQQDRYLDVHGAGEFKPIPIAVTAFSGDAAAGSQIDHRGHQ